MRDASATVILGAIESLTMDQEEELSFKEEKPSGIVLFKRNIPSQDYHLVTELITRFQALSSTPAAPCLIAIDQEGGRVARLGQDFPNQGPALDLAHGKSDQESLNQIKSYSTSVARELTSLGINLNFAPVVDILSEEKNHSIGDRCFGRDAHSVSLRAGAFVEGHREQGIDVCLKHFPGQGHSLEDTHEQSSRIELPLALMGKRELIPFRDLASSTRFVMMSHSIYPSLDNRPASLSKLIIQDILKTKLGFQGIVVSDDMNMKAIAQDLKAWQLALIESLMAGVDLLLICRGLDRIQSALAALRQEEKKSPAFAKRLSHAASRVMKVRNA